MWLKIGFSALPCLQSSGAVQELYRLYTTLVAEGLVYLPLYSAKASFRFFHVILYIPW